MELGNHFILSLPGASFSEADRDLFSEIKPAGLFLDAANFDRTRSYAAWLKKYEKLIEDAQKYSGRQKLILCIDHEGGRITRTPKPFTRAPFAGEYASYAGEVGEIHGQELASLGINLIFGPVLDIFSNPANPVIGPRSFADNAEDVVKAARAYIAGLRKYGVAVCPKHFPGHGATEQDTHHGFAQVDADKSVLYRRELAPFKQLIDSDALSAIMTAHVKFLNVDPENPATLSAKVLRHILRDEFKFNGVTISDDLDMGAIKDNYSDEACALGVINAGVDLILFNHHPERSRMFCAALSKALNEGKISAATLEDSSKRVVSFLHTLSPHKVSELPDTQFAKHKQMLLAHKSHGANDAAALGVEPKPRPLPLPKKSFPVRVGVVIEGDDRRELTLTPEFDTLGAASNGEKFELKAGNAYTICVNDGELSLSGSEISSRKIIGVLKVTHPKGSELRPHAGLKLSPLLAGRHFHWKKEIEASFCGTLEFHPSDDVIVVVNALDFEAYITCVVGSEMSGKGLPAEFAKAQATAARSWAYVFLGNKYPGKPYSVCNDDMSQRYQGTSHISAELIEQIKPCAGFYLVRTDGAVVPGYYSKSTGGHGELPENVFGFDVPGMGASYDCPDDKAPKLDLRKEADFIQWLDELNSKGRDIYCSPEVVNDEALSKLLGAVDTMDKYYRWTHTTTADVIIKNLKEKFSVADVDYLTDLSFEPRGVSGRYVRGVVKYVSTQGNQKSFVLPNQFCIRACMHPSFLYSSAFVFEAKKLDGRVLDVAFRGAGWGHGAGLCQIGALGMALGGKLFASQSYQEILKHYFPDSSLVRAY